MAKRGSATNEQTDKAQPADMRTELLLPGQEGYIPTAKLVDEYTSKKQRVMDLEELLARRIRRNRNKPLEIGGVQHVSRVKKGIDEATPGAVYLRPIHPLGSKSNATSEY